MIPNDNFRFCKDCSKNVIDFTLLKNDEIISFILNNRNQKICGNLDNRKKTFSHDELIAVIDKELIHNKKTNYGFYLLLIAAFSFTSCSQNNEKENHKNSKIIENKIISSKHGSTIDSIKQVEKNDKGVKTRKGDVTMLPSNSGNYKLNPDFGDVNITYNLDNNHIYTNTEKLPMYKGGIEKLYSFIRKNLIYPEWEKHQKIEGRVILSFIVEKDGSISNPKVLRVPEGSQNLGNEALRILKLMPKWIPAENFDEKVRFYYSIPVLFKIKD